MMKNAKNVTVIGLGNMETNTAASFLLTETRQRLVDVWEAHTRYEFEKKDVEGTMSTMIDAEAHIINIPSMQGGIGNAAVRYFYANNFLISMPDDLQSILISRTVGDTQIVDETILKFTHTIRMDWILPGIEPTGKKVEVSVIAIVGFREGKVSHEHIYWDQATVLAQVGLIDASKLPVFGEQGTKAVLERMQD